MTVTLPLGSSLHHRIPQERRQPWRHFTVLLLSPKGAVTKDIKTWLFRAYLCVVVTGLSGGRRFGFSWLSAWVPTPRQRAFTASLVACHQAHLLGWFSARVKVSQTGLWVPRNCELRRGACTTLPAECLRRGPPPLWLPSLPAASLPQVTAAGIRMLWKGSREEEGRDFGVALATC